MIKLLLVNLFLLMTFNVFTQKLLTFNETIDPSLTWPWNWDITADENRLIAVNENGFLNIQKDGVWEIIEVDPNSNLELRGVEKSDDGTIWFTSTENGLWSYDINGVLTNYTSDNSFLPVDNLRDLAIRGNEIWISTDGLGLIKHDFVSEETTHFTKDQNTNLKSDFNLDPHFDPSGNVWFSNRECLSKVTPDLQWVNEDMRVHIGGSGVKDMHIESDSEIWIAMDGGLVLYDGSEYNVVLQDQFDRYIKVFKDSRGDIWLSKNSTINGDGITVIYDDKPYFFNYDDYPNIPNQVFEFVEYQDTVMAVGTVGNNVIKLVFEPPSSSNDLSAPTLKVYPNPALTELNVFIDSFDKIKNWSLHDLSGRKVLSGNSKPNTLDISHLSSGSYMLNVDLNSGSISKQVYITH